jgi:hypothetical protein
MISLTCTHCQAVLSIDDAFAGGVCRCQHCGTIQTVPSHLKTSDTVGASSATAKAGSGPKALYQAHRGGTAGESTGSGTGLEDLADVVASSGLAGSGLSAAAKKRKKPHRSIDSKVVAIAPAKSRTPMVIAGAAVAVLIVAAVAWWLMSHGNQTTATNTTPDVQAAPDGAPPAMQGPSFCGVSLTGNSIVYLLDRGDSARDVFDGMKEATFKSILSLGSDRKFQVLFWDNGTTEAGYPNGSTTYATSENIDACKKAIEDVFPEHQSSIETPLTRAVGEGPDAIVIVTAKGFELDDSFTAAVTNILHGNAIKLYTLSIRTDSAPLQSLAKATGGSYKCLSEGALSAGGQQ